MIYAEHPLNTSAASDTYRTAPRKHGFINQHIPANSPDLPAVKRELGLFMGEGLLSLCLSCLDKQRTPVSIEVLYLLDSLSELYTRRPETQTLMGFETDSDDRAAALSALIDRCRAAHRVTPPLKLCSVLNALHDTLALGAPPCIHDTDPAVHFRLCQPTEVAALPANGYTLLSTQQIGNTPWVLVCHAPHVETPTRAVRRGDSICLLHGAADTPTPAECAAAQVLLKEISGKMLHRVLPVEPQMLLPTALAPVKGMTVNCAAFTDGEGAALPYPCDLVKTAPGGWLLFLPPDAVEPLQSHAASCSLTLTPFATVRGDHILEFEPRYDEQQVRIHRSLTDAIEISCAYRLSETSATPPPAVTPTTPPLCHKKSGFGGCGHCPDTAELSAWLVPTRVLGMDDGFDANALVNTVSALQADLQKHGSFTPVGASLAIGLQITPTLSRTTLWQYVLQLYHTLRQSALPCLPISIAHTESGVSQMTLTLLCRKPFDRPPTEQSTEPLPLPYCSSAPHTDHPPVLIAYTPAVGSIDGMADTLHRAGGNVQTLRISGGDEGCTVLADAIDQARLVLLVGAGEPLSDILTHPRVLTALQSLVSRDGLCLAQGDIMEALCHTGLLPLRSTDLTEGAPQDVYASAFPYPVGAVSSLATPDAAPVFRVLPSRLPVLVRDPSPDEPLLSPFRSLQGHPVLAITPSDDGAPLAVRLRGQDGHILIYADGFDASHLQAALDYCR